MAHVMELKAKRRRASAPKKRTGCGTCKYVTPPSAYLRQKPTPYNRIRHKRCDEAKPVCNICQKTGRICDGYIDPSTGKQFGGHADRNSPFLGILPRTLFDNEVEAQGFRFFETATEIQLAAALRNHGWTPPLLQLSHQDPAIRHAVIANGIMSRRYQASEISASTEPQANNLSQAALQQYCKAIACFRFQLGASLESPDVNPTSLETAPACFVLLIMFEFMQGNASGLMIHLKHANKLATTFPRSRQAQSFINLLALIETVAIMWLNLDLSHSDASPCLQELNECPRPLKSPLGPDSLYYDLSWIKDDVLKWRCAVESAHKDSTTQVVKPGCFYAVSRQTIQSKLDSWNERWITRPPNDEDRAPHYYSLLRVNYLFTVLVVDEVHQRQSSAPPGQNESAHSRDKSKSDHFNEIIESTTSVLEAGHSISRYYPCAEEEPLEAAGLLPLFSFRHSFIQPLFYVAQNAPQITLRQRAIRLLMEKPWREGAWDSYIMGSIAKSSLGGIAGSRSMSRKDLI
ncbi:hypothetical protein F1880_009045 [Penicillium rolfsii]|nr:hypothetical protein F1880_009045 [Penicillium rolfsii]